MRSYSLETIIVALTFIDAHDRDLWLNIGNALKTEFGEIAFSVFDSWSQSADNYDAKAVKSTWNGYTLGKVTIGTVIYYAKQNGFDQSKHESKPIDPQEQAARQAKREQQEREAIANEQAEHAAYMKLLPQIDRCVNRAISTPYAESKDIAENLFSINSNDLHRFKNPIDSTKTIGYYLNGLITLVPYKRLDTKQLVAFQAINGAPDSEGKNTGRFAKQFIGKVFFGRGYYWIGDIDTQGVKIIVEGMSDANTLFEKVGYCSLAAGKDTQLTQAALDLRQHCQNDFIIIFGDNDKNGKGQRLAQAASQAIKNSIFLLPPPQYKDVNEWYLAEGCEGIKKMIDAAIDSKKAAPSDTEDAAQPTNTTHNEPIIADGLHGGEGQGDESKATPKPKLIAVTIGQLVNMALPPRENLLAPWLPMQGLAMVYAPRGIGKTFFALNVAYAVASGGEFLCWQAPQAQTVLYIDGEMPAISMQERLESIITMHSAEAHENALRIITPDLQDGNPMPDLATIEGQRDIEPFLDGVKLIVIDNISTLCRSGTENEAEGWVIVQAWALRQRSAGRSVLFVHHAGKGGNQRGTSKREDVLDTVINLKRPIDYNPSEGANFEVHFEKTRGFSGEEAEPLACRLGTDEHHAPAWLYSRLEDNTFDKVVSLINEGLSQAEIASELDINKSNVSRHVKKARLQGLIQEPKAKAKPVTSANYSRFKDGE
jgi:putative DNA primase/helicase